MQQQDGNVLCATAPFAGGTHGAPQPQDVPCSPALTLRLSDTPWENLGISEKPGGRGRLNPGKDLVLRPRLPRLHARGRDGHRGSGDWSKGSIPTRLNGSSLCPGPTSFTDDKCLNGSPGIQQQPARHGGKKSSYFVLNIMINSSLCPHVHNNTMQETWKTATRSKGQIMHSTAKLIDKRHINMGCYWRKCQFALRVK